MLKNEYTSIYACQDTAAKFLAPREEDLRPPFFHDADRIIYSLAFSRYLDKTQVFTFQKHDHLTKRMTHVIYVSKIARMIGRALGLNEDLIEAAALGHDLGHTPFGHVGEKILNDISLKANEGYFNHNIHSVRLLKDIENYGNGLNISLQVLDAIMCHNGELVQGKYEPIAKSPEEFLKEYNESYQDAKTIAQLRPMTLEGCVVRISDLIAYLGRDIEDGLRLNIIKVEDIPTEIKNVLGVKNRKIIATIVNDLITNSKNKNYLELSPKVYEAIKSLKAFNYAHIYAYAYTPKEKKELEVILETLYDTYLIDLEAMNPASPIVKYYQVMSEKYQKNSKKRIVIDYIAGMTDDYAIKEYNNILKTKHTKKEVNHDL